MQHHSTLSLVQTGRQARSELSLFVTEISILLRIVYSKHFNINPLVQCLSDVFVIRCCLVVVMTLTDSSYFVFLYQSGCTDLCFRVVRQIYCVSLLWCRDQPFSVQASLSWWDSLIVTHFVLDFVDTPMCYSSVCLLSDSHFRLALFLSPSVHACQSSDTQLSYLFTFLLFVEKGN